MKPYPEPVARLLALGDPGGLGGEWPDYLGFGLGAEHVPDLIRMATDPALNRGDPDSPEVWAPLHAWRVLGELKAVEGIGPLLALLEDEDMQDDDWVREELPGVFGKMGPAAIPPLAARLANPRHGRDLRIAAARGLGEIAQENPGARGECVTALSRMLDDPLNSDRELNGLILGCLLDLDAVESADVIQRAFEWGNIDESIAGDWEEVRYELGLVERPARRSGRGFGMQPAPRNWGGPSPKQKAEQRRKQAKASRKRNRNKKK
jgi:hypothetical protein